MELNGVNARSNAQPNQFPGETRDYVRSVMANSLHYALLLENRSTTLKARMGLVPGRQNGDDASAEELP